MKSHQFKVSIFSSTLTSTFALALAVAPGLLGLTTTAVHAAEAQAQAQSESSGLIESTGDAVPACPLARWICYVGNESETYYGCGETRRGAYRAAYDSCDGSGGNTFGGPCNFQGCQRM